MNKAAAEQLVRQRPGGRCEGGCGRSGQEYAHRRAKGQGGAWSPANALRLCRSCHAMSHAQPVTSRDAGWILPAGIDPLRMPALIWTPNGPGWWRLTEDAGYEWVDRDDLPMLLDPSLAVPLFGLAA